MMEVFKGLGNSIRLILNNDWNISFLSLCICLCVCHLHHSRIQANFLFASARKLFTQQPRNDIIVNCDLNNGLFSSRHYERPSPSLPIKKMFGVVISLPALILFDIEIDFPSIFIVINNLMEPLKLNYWTKQTSKMPMNWWQCKMWCFARGKVTWGLCVLLKSLAAWHENCYELCDRIKWGHLKTTHGREDNSGVEMK